MFDNKGRMAVRYVDFSCHWASILAVGLKRDPRHDDPSKYTKKENEDFEIYRRLESLMGLNLRDMMLRFGPEAPVEFGRANAHSTDVHVVKAVMGAFLDGHGYNPNKKHEMGFKNKRCAKLLCPADLDYDADLDYKGNPGRHRRLQKNLRDGTHVPTPVDLAKFLFHNELVDPKDLSAGFLKNELLVQTYKAIFISPSSAQDGGNKGTTKGNAAQHNISKTNLESIIYAAHLDHFVLSSQPTYKATGGQGQFNYRLFYKTIKDIVMMWPQSNIDSLLQWWDEKIFPESAIQPMAKRADGALSIAQRMMAQAEVARQAQEDEAASRVESQSQCS
ncbi:hypothetical protein C8R44DRAFT_854662 [Mycena epipterygia]|nr:hypothetical protein C8R44DRAFT_854662 [Mycena epipterygia]